MDAAIVATTRSVLAERDEEVAALFYARLFELCPEIRPLFPRDMADQGRKLVSTLIVAINALDDWDALAPVLAALARRHVNYGVRPWHYGVVTKALVDALAATGARGDQIAAWGRLMSVISDHMIRTAYGDRAMLALSDAEEWAGGT